MFVHSLFVQRTNQEKHPETSLPFGFPILHIQNRPRLRRSYPILNIGLGSLRGINTLTENLL